MDAGPSVILGIDVGGTKVGLGLVSRDGTILQRRQYPMERLPISVWTRNLQREIALLEAQAPESPPLGGIGLAFRGIIDHRRQVLRSSTILELEEGFDLCGELRQAYSVPVYLENDVKAATLAEIQYGIGRSRPDFGCINIGTGLGMGIVAGGQLLHGCRDGCGEIGGCPLLREDGSLDCLESVVSGEGIDREVRRLAARFPAGQLQPGTEKVSASQVFAAWASGDPLASAVAGGLLRTFARKLVDIEAILDLGQYVLMGGVAANPLFLPRLRRELAGISYRGCRWQADVALSGVGPADIGLKGAASVPLYYAEHL
jgi:glucokinase